MAKKPKPTKPPKPVETVYRYRSAVTGRFVGERYAKRHPRTTVKETLKRGSTVVPKKQGGWQSKKRDRK
jgi:hypothetical protein